MATRSAYVNGEEAEIMHVDASTALTATEKAQVDVQIATAKRFPRVIGECIAEARALALADEETAEAMFYALPRDGKVIEGPSARLAEIMAYTWGNLRAETDVESVDDTTLTAVGTCFDLQKNVAIRTRVKRRITTSAKNGRSARRFSEDMIVVTGNAASSIALRNAVFKVIPGAYWKPIYEDARRLAMGSADSIGRRWKKALEFFASLAITEDRVLAAIGRETVHDVTPEDFLKLSGLRTALREGDTTVEEAFPRPGTAPTNGSAADLNAKLSEKEPPKPSGPTAAEILAAQRQKIVTYVAETPCAGGNAPDEMRDSAREMAYRVFEEGEEREAVVAWIDHEDAGRKQMSELGRSLELAAQALEGVQQPGLGLD